MGGAWMTWRGPQPPPCSVAAHSQTNALWTRVKFHPRRQKDRVSEEKGTCGPVCVWDDWLFALGSDRVRVTQRDSQRGVLETCQDLETEASWQLEPTVTHTHHNCSTDSEVEMARVWWSASPRPRLGPQGFRPKTWRTPPRLFCWCLLQLHPTADVASTETGSALQGGEATRGRLNDVL